MRPSGVTSRRCPVSWRPASAGDGVRTTPRWHTIDPWCASAGEPIHPPHPADAAKFIAAAPHGMAACLRLLAETGMRMTEAAQLERWQVDEIRKQITLTRTKTSPPRTLCWQTPAGMPPRRLAAGHPEGFLYRNRDGKPHAEFSSNAFRVMRNLIEREKTAGCHFRPFRVHDLRHAFAVRALKAGMSIYALSRHLGHSSVTTTERHYLGFLTWEEQEAVRQAGAVQVAQERQHQNWRRRRPRNAGVAQTVAHPAATFPGLRQQCRHRDHVIYWKHIRISGWGGIRTHGGLAPTAVFKTAALNRSATHPCRLAFSVTAC